MERRSTVRKNVVLKEKKKVVLMVKKDCLAGNMFQRCSNCEEKSWVDDENGKKKGCFDGEKKVVSTVKKVVSTEIKCFNSVKTVRKNNVSTMRKQLVLTIKKSCLKEQCHEDFAVLGQFCAKIITLRL